MKKLITLILMMASTFLIGCKDEPAQDNKGQLVDPVEGNKTSGLLKIDLPAGSKNQYTQKGPGFYLTSEYQSDDLTVWHNTYEVRIDQLPSSWEIKSSVLEIIQNYSEDSPWEKETLDALRSGVVLSYTYECYGSPVSFQINKHDLFM